MNILIASVASFFASILVMSAIMAILAKRRKTIIDELEGKCNSLERQIHLNETKFLEQNNLLEIKYRVDAKLIREEEVIKSEKLEKVSFNMGMDSAKVAHSNEISKIISDYNIKLSESKRELEDKHRGEQDKLREMLNLQVAKSEKKGYEVGKSESENNQLMKIMKIKSDCTFEVATLKSEHRDNIIDEKEKAASEARRQSKIEFEQQSKLFSVVIKPYVKIERDSGFFTDDFKMSSGYQYQLLVSGIPAFQPHVVIDHSEEIKKIIPEVQKLALELAKQSASAAIDLYLNGVSKSALNIGSEIIENVVK